MPPGDICPIAFRNSARDSTAEVAEPTEASAATQDFATAEFRGYRVPLAAKPVFGEP
jgi:hypothetical protein